MLPSHGQIEWKYDLTMEAGGRDCDVPNGEPRTPARVLEEAGELNF
jgi:hypothetical protein